MDQIKAKKSGIFDDASSTKKFLEEQKAAIKARVKDKPVLLLISGGVDSSVCAALLSECLKSKQLHLLYIDTGLMRLNESQKVMKTLSLLKAQNLYRIDAEAYFLAALKGITDPEAKRQIIGDMFVKVQDKEVQKLGLPKDYFLAQGTIYPDLAESGKGTGKKTGLVKSHHNVRSPLLEQKRVAGLVLEPLKDLYKSEVRQLGRMLGLPEELINRHPFPGPGLGVRMLGEVTKEKCDILRQADAIFTDELVKRGLYDKIWQAFAVLLPLRSVGVTDGERRYGWTVALRAINSVDGMSAEVFDLAMQDLREISALISSQVPEVGRLVYDITDKPPATIEWE